MLIKLVRFSHQPRHPKVMFIPSQLASLAVSNSICMRLVLPETPFTARMVQPTWSRLQGSWASAQVSFQSSASNAPRSTKINEDHHSFCNTTSKSGFFVGSDSLFAQNEEIPLFFCRCSPVQSNALGWPLPSSLCLLKFYLCWMMQPVGLPSPSLSFSLLTKHPFLSVFMVKPKFTKSIGVQPFIRKQIPWILPPFEPSLLFTLW